MDLGPLKQFVLWRGEKRLVMGEDDLQISKISSVFKVSSHIPLPFVNDGLRCVPLSTSRPAPQLFTCIRLPLNGLSF